MPTIDYNPALTALTFGAIGSAPTAVEAAHPLPIGLYRSDGSLIAPDDPAAIIPATLACLGDEFVTDLSAAVALAAIPANAKFALLQAEVANIRLRCKGAGAGNAPTAATGLLLQAGDSLPWNASLANLRFIAAASGAKLNVLYFG